MQALRDGLPALIESTVNQVNQFGGYTGLTPKDWGDFVGRVGAESGFPPDRLILGGDHLGPYPWRSERAEAALKKARDLVAASIHAGFTKIHLDASMPLGGDPIDRHGALDPRLVAQREAELAAAAEDARGEARGPRSGATLPVYVIGTEVPAPGGISAAAELSEREGPTPLAITAVEDLLESVSLCKTAFRARGLEAAWTRVCAVVTQPGVEYGDQEVRAYDRARAAPLCNAARRLPDMVLEGHSTDYQTVAHLRELVEDGVAILKVGPALTFALRECLFSLELIEQELLQGAAAERSDLSETLERAMVAEPGHWKDYYGGSQSQKRRARRYSLSDRSRYYWSKPAVADAVERLLANLRHAAIPGTLLSQFLPLHYAAVREGRLGTDPRELLRESVRRVLEGYSAAARGE